ncbi:VOC family protein [Brooklawnia cerclae]|uniref:Glyoxylase I family protein n=1 Tax=Brooklawnia cerclae TaxID=349934 RepID=A0ABX0SJL1_9ACTN|nr:VOC family protein [Brooklawnia cerclae]NIH56932.1 glyoxylase I family protein [Brooklawnia cerclae]
MSIPGMRGMDHVGFTVPDLEQAHDFFVDVLGCEYFFELGPFESKGGTWLSEHVNVDDRAVFRNRHYRCGNGSNFEIFEYELDGRDEQQPLNSDVGGHHLGFYVDDIDAAIEYLRSRGVEVLGEPTSSSGPATGQRWVYFLAPWGMQMELVSYPQGKVYEQASQVRLWSPVHPER